MDEDHKMYMRTQQYGQGLKMVDDKDDNWWENSRDWNNVLAR
jgi:hypothetical protein